MLPSVNSYFSCPNEESLKITCHGIDITAMLWISEPYIPSRHPIIYIPEQIGEISPDFSMGPFSSTLTNLTRRGEGIQLADMVSDLTLTTSGVANNTTIVCKTYRGHRSSQRSIIFYHTGKKLIVYSVIKCCHY